MIADGKVIAKTLERELATKLAGFPSNNKEAEVCFVLFGDDADSKQFITMKSNVAERLGIVVNVLQYPSDITTEKAVEVVRGLADKKYSGIVVQLPLPPQLDREQILNTVPSELDIDVLSDKAKADYTAKISTKTPPVARAVLEILNFYKISLENKKIVILGNGKLVGQPVGMMFSVMNVPFTVVDEHTEEKEKSEMIKSADIIISGVGVPHMLHPDMVKDGVVLIDAGTSEQGNKLVGDIDPSCAEKAALLTPVPGGVGPVTVISLFLNMFS